MAGMVFEEYKEYGSVNPAKLIGRFEDAGQQQRAAELFSTKLDAPMDEQGRKKEFADTVVRVKQNSLDVQYARAVEQNDFAKLQRIIKERRELGKLHSSLNLG